MRLVLVLVLAIATADAVAQSPPVLGFDRTNDAAVERIRELDAAIEKKDWRGVANLAQIILDAAIAPPPAAEESEDPSRTDVDLLAAMYPDPHAPSVFYSASQYVSRRLMGLPPEGIAAYRRIHGVRAAAALRRARLTDDERGLDDLQLRYRATEAGLEALCDLGHAALERGEAALAARYFEDFLEAAWRDEYIGRRRGPVRAALALAYRQLGERRLLEALSRGEDEAPFVHAGEDTTVAAAATAWLRSAPPRPSGFPGLATAGGLDASPGPRSSLAAVWSTPPDTTRRDPDLDVLRPEPTVLGDLVVYHTRWRARALDLDTGKIRWTHSFAEGAPDRRRPVPASDDGQTRRLRGSLGEGLYVFVSRPRKRPPEGAARSLVALRATTGRVVWQVPSNLLGEGRPELLWDDAPLICGDRVFATATTTDDNPGSLVIALRRDDGRPVWISRVGGGVLLPYRTRDGDVPDAARWRGCAPLTHRRGLLFAVDNLGTYAVVEARTGRPRHLLRYERRRVESEGRFEEGALARGWDGNPVLVEGDRAVVAPDDADVAYFLYTHPPLDAERRRRNRNYLRADTHPREGMTQLLGFRDGVAVVAGRDPYEELTVLNALSPFVEDGRERVDVWASSAPLDGPITGRGYLAKNDVYVCSRKYVYRIDLSSGAVSDPILSHEGSDGAGHLGPVVVTGTGLIIASPRSVTLYRDGAGESGR